MNALVKSILALSILLGVSSTATAHAQWLSKSDSAATTALTLDPSYAAELDSINNESRWATGMYVSGVVLHVAGLATTAASFLLAIASFSSCSFAAELGSRCSSSGADVSAMLGVGLATSALGLAMIGVGIGLDVDSGSRRGGLRARHQTAVSDLRIDAGLGALGVSGRF